MTQTVNPRDQRKRELAAAQAAFARQMMAKESQGQPKKGRKRRRSRR